MKNETLVILAVAVGFLVYQRRHGAPMTQGASLSGGVTGTSGGGDSLASDPVLSLPSTATPPILGEQPTMHALPAQIASPDALERSAFDPLNY